MTASVTFFNDIIAKKAMRNAITFFNSFVAKKVMVTMSSPSSMVVVVVVVL
jgi:hypothetical protein